MCWTEGDVIRKLRIAAGWSLLELERRAHGVRFTTISRIELGKTKEPKRSTLDRIAAAFGWTGRQLIEAIPPGTLIITPAAVVTKGQRADDESRVNALKRDVERELANAKRRKLSAGKRRKTG